jgi:hypothetical protein
MAAHPSSDDSHCPSRHDSSEVVSVAPSEPGVSVISVSARKTAEGAMAAVESDPAPLQLVDQAAALCEALAELVDQSQRSAAKADAASIRLQERLRLGARVLKAFSIQVARIESTLAQAHQRQEQIKAIEGEFEGHLDAISKRQASALAEFERRALEATAAAIELLDEHVKRRSEPGDDSAAPQRPSRVASQIEPKSDRPAQQSGATPPLRLRTWA